MSTSRTFASGAVLTAAQQNDLAQGTLGYAQVTANQAGITTAVDLTGLTITFTVVAGRRLRISAQINMFSSVTSDRVDLTILQDGAQIQDFTQLQQTGNVNQSISSSIIVQPGAGSHTYKLQLARVTGTGSVTMAASATLPAFIHAEDIGV